MIFFTGDIHTTISELLLLFPKRVKKQQNIYYNSLKISRILYNTILAEIILYRGKSKAYRRLKQLVCISGQKHQYLFIEIKKDKSKISSRIKNRGQKGFGSA